jgi:alpha-galactosidase
MAIRIDEKSRTFHLHNGALSYIVKAYEGGQLGLLHFGRSLDPELDYGRLWPYPTRDFSQGEGDVARFECPANGTGDWRPSAIEIEQADGSRILSPAYVGYRLIAGKEKLSGLPSTYVEEESEAEGLELKLVDEPSGIEIYLSYTIFRDYPAVARSMRVRNAGKKAAILRCAMSASIDFPPGEWTMLSLGGAWAREFQLESRKAGGASGSQRIYSRRGASSAQHNPFVVLASPGANEEWGEAYGASLVYSGNFIAEADASPNGAARLRIGIEPDSFAWKLESGDEFQSPEAVLVYSNQGLGSLSEAYHGLYKKRLARGAWRDRPRPILVNNWEGTYFNFDEERLLGIARAAAKAGVELFVLDDGWFGRRDDDTSSLGDWEVDERKLPGGLARLVKGVNDLGLSFGLWFEPEMLSRKSRLFEAHPDWAIGAPGRPRTERRNQYVLDFTRPEIVDYIHDKVAAVLGSANIAYVKWDMNRNITEAFGSKLGPDRQGEFFHRYILGVYDLYRRLTSEFPKVLFESCASGGGRFDPGMLAYAPQGWLSDDTDACERVGIQWGASLCYPASSMGAHVSAAPNHQVGRVTSLSFRASVAFFGAFGYELDMSALSKEELEEIAGQIALYKERRALFQYGRFLRLLSPYEGERDEAAWLSLDERSGAAVAAYYSFLARPNAAAGRLRLRGLDPRRSYRVSVWPSSGDATEKDNSGIRRGDELMGVGLSLGQALGWARPRGDFWSRLFFLDPVKE